MISEAVASSGIRRARDAGTRVNSGTSGRAVACTALAAGLNRLLTIAPSTAPNAKPIGSTMRYRNGGAPVSTPSPSTVPTPSTAPMTIATHQRCARAVAASHARCATRAALA